VNSVGMGLGSSKGLRMPGLGMPGLAGPSSIFTSTGYLAQPEKKVVYRDIPMGATGHDFSSSVPVNFSALSIGSVVVPKPLPPFYEQNTSFECNRSADEIFAAIGLALKGCQNVLRIPEEGRYKGHCEKIGQFISFQVHLFKKSEGGGHLVEFQRRRGDSCAFWHFFMDSMDVLSKDLADAADFVRTCPRTSVTSKNAMGKSKITCTEKTLDSMLKMANSCGCFQLDALQVLNTIVDSEEHESSTLSKITKAALAACASKDELVSMCGKTLLSKVAKTKESAEETMGLVGKELTKKMLGILAKNTLATVKPVYGGGAKSDFSKANGKVPDLGSREHIDIYSGIM